MQLRPRRFRSCLKYAIGHGRLQTLIPTGKISGLGPLAVKFVKAVETEACKEISLTSDNGDVRRFNVKVMCFRSKGV